MQAAPDTTVEPQPRQRPRLEFLTGIRGIMSLFVMLRHIWLLTAIAPFAAEAPQAYRIFIRWAQYPHHNVAVFVVLSGLTLMLPVAASADHTLRGGFFGYLKRRARRILPSYYFALAFSMGVTLLITGAKHLLKSRVAFRTDASEYTPSGFVSHLFMAHNLRRDWSLQIDAPMWSMATEWDLYLLFPLVLLPVWRRWGMAVCFAAASALGLSFHFLLPPRINGDWACPWYCGIFAIGMAASWYLFGPRAAGRRISPRPWLIASICIAAVTAAFLQYTPGENDLVKHDNVPYTTIVGDYLVGALSACIMIYCGTHVIGPLPRAHSWLLRSLDSKIPLKLGGFSYSLYLCHMPILERLQMLLIFLHRSPTLIIALMWTVGPALCLGLSYLFHLKFERPFISRFTKRALDLKPAAAE